MKAFIAIFAILVSTQVSFAAIKCDGYQQESQDKEIYVEIDGNPLKIFMKDPKAKNAGLSLLVNVLEETNIMAENKVYGTQPQVRADFQIKPTGLPRGYDAKLIVRELSPNTPVPVSKLTYVLKCSGKLPAVYQN